MSRNILKVGQIISSDEFAFGYQDHDRRNDVPVISIDGKPGSHTVSRAYSEDDRLIQSIKRGKVLPKYFVTDNSSYDPSRATAHFVIERSEMYDVSQSELLVTARRLFPSGLYDPEGELIQFYFPRCNHTNSVSNLTVDRRCMKLFFI